MADLQSDWETAKPIVAQSEWDNAMPIEPSRPEPNYADRINAAFGGANKGIAGLLGLPVDTAENIANLGIAGFGSAATALGRPDLAPDVIRGTPGGSESISRLMNKAGINTANPRPDDAASRMLNTGGMIAGGSMVPGAGVKGTLASAVGGSVAGEAIGPEWTGVGSLLPGVAGQVNQSARNAWNTRAAKSASVLDTFKKAGAQPSAGQVTDSAFLHGLENLAAKFPGGSGVMKSFIESQQRAIGNTVKTGVPAEAAGRAIERGVTGEVGFLERTKATWNQLDDALAAKIPAEAGTKPSNTLQALDDMTRPTQGAEKTSRVMSTPKIAEIRGAMNSDLSGVPPERTITLLGADGKTPLMQIPVGGTPGSEVMPYQALRELRSKVGSMLDNALVTGIPGGELKRLYGAISKDLEIAATQAGAGQEFARQNAYYKARMGRIEDVLDRVIGKGRQPEDIFKTAIPTEPDQANKLRSVMRSLEPSERKVVSEAVANRLGRAKPGSQNAEGDVFSSETFLTNWNRLSPGAKAQLFPDPPLRANIDKVAKVSANIRSGKGIYANPSGTAGSFAAYSVYSSPIVAIATGSIAPVIAGGGAAAAANIGAKMMTNPKVVEWLATPVNVSKPGDSIAHLIRLSVIYNNSKDEGLKKEISDFVQQAGGTQ